MLTGYFISVFLHILCAMIWVGGLIFFVIVFVPLLRNPDYKNVAPKIVLWAGERFRFWGWIVFGLLLTTGLYNVFARGYSWGDFFKSEFYDSHFGHTLGIKITLFMLLLVLGGLHDFWLGPKATRMWRDTPDHPSVSGLRKAASWIGRVNLLISLIIVFLAVMIVRGNPW